MKNMKKMILTIIILGFAISGVYAQEVKDGEKRKQKKEVEEETFFDYAFVTLNNAETFKVRNLKINTDSIQYMSLSTRQHEIRALNDVLFLKVRTKKRQLLKYAIIGGAAGVTVSLIALIVITTNPSDGGIDTGVTNTGEIDTGGIIMLATLPIIGAGIGSIFGLKHKWKTFSPNEKYGYFQSINVGPYLGQNSYGLTVILNMR